MDLATHPIFQFIAQYAYEPGIVYGVIVIMMVLSSFGIPIPEEVTLLSAGTLAYIGAHPEIYPPPYPDAPVVSIHATAIVCFFAVFLSDLLVFMLGRKLGSRMLSTGHISRLIKPHHMAKVHQFTSRYGALACGVFRFTPGLRFPGHFACGSVGVPVWKFIAVDGTAALISVPTQVLLIGYYGETIILVLKEAKILLLFLVGAVVIIWAYRTIKSRSNQRGPRTI